jgi:hypothetical protein
MKPRTEAFTLVELLVAAAIGAAIIGAAVVGFAVVSQSSVREGARNVTLPGGLVANMYGTNSSFVTVGANPNYFQAAQARRMKERLLADVSSAAAVFCLGRNVPGNAASRVYRLSLPNREDFRTNATPQAFRNFLVRHDSSLADIFPAQQAGALLETTNATVYVVGYLRDTSEYNNELTMLATYEVDFVPTPEPDTGTFASVRRYTLTNQAVPTDYYHLFYPDESNGSDGFRPLSAFFSRKKAAQGSDPFAVAENQPFTFLWWPDPLSSRLGGSSVPAASATVRSNYANMAGRTSLFFVLPAFPPL